MLNLSLQGASYVYIPDLYVPSFKHLFIKHYHFQLEKEEQLEGPQAQTQHSGESPGSEVGLKSNHKIPVGTTNKIPNRSQEDGSVGKALARQV